MIRDKRPTFSMASPSSPTVTALYRYPVKGLAPQQLQQVELRAGETIPFDRAWAIENGPGRFDPDHPVTLPKISFLMLMRNERLAALDMEFDEATSTLTLLRDGKQVARGALDTLIGRQLIEQFIAGYMADDLRGAPRIVHAEGHSFSDVAAKCVHIVNLASVRELERATGRPVDPLRFRANVYVEAETPWVEFDWLDRSITAGEATLRVFDRTSRCEATNVDPATGARDMAIPATLMRAYGHQDFGVYAMVEKGGLLRPGDMLAV
jgi:uncharacterized protein YcbX